MGHTVSAPENARSAGNAFAFLAPKASHIGQTFITSDTITLRWMCSVTISEC